MTTETENPKAEPSDAPRRSESLWLTLVAWLCLLWVFVAFGVFFGTIDNIDVDGATKKEFLPFEPLIACVFFTGLAAIPIGFGCGLWSLLFRKQSISLLPTVVLVFLLAAICTVQVTKHRTLNEAGDCRPEAGVPGFQPFPTVSSLQPCGRIKVAFTNNAENLHSTTIVWQQYTVHRFWYQWNASPAVAVPTTPIND